MVAEVEEEHWLVVVVGPHSSQDIEAWKDNQDFPLQHRMPVVEFQDLVLLQLGLRACQDLVVLRGVRLPLILEARVDLLAYPAEHPD